MELTLTEKFTWKRYFRIPKASIQFSFPIPVLCNFNALEMFYLVNNTVQYRKVISRTSTSNQRLVSQSASTWCGVLRSLAFTFAVVRSGGFGLALIALPKCRLRIRNPVRMWMGAHKLRKRLFSVSKGRRLGMYKLIFALHYSPHGHPWSHSHTFVSLAIFCMYILPLSEQLEIVSD